MIKALNTNYKGYRFRSRLEARWAVFLDRMKIRYSYEPVGVELPSGLCYLPDFYLPDFNMFIEVKGPLVGEKDTQKIIEFVKESRVPVILLDSDPDMSMYSTITPSEEDEGYCIPIQNLFHKKERGSLNLKN